MAYLLNASMCRLETRSKLSKRATWQLCNCLVFVSTKFRTNFEQLHPFGKQFILYSFDCYIHVHRLAVNQNVTAILNVAQQIKSQCPTFDWMQDCKQASKELYTDTVSLTLVDLMHSIAFMCRLYMSSLLKFVLLHDSCDHADRLHI